MGGSFMLVISSRGQTEEIIPCRSEEDAKDRLMAWAFSQRANGKQVEMSDSGHYAVTGTNLIAFVLEDTASHE